MDPFAPRDDAALDYWFWKFHVGDLAFLVDVIVRRGTGSSETRVSCWAARDWKGAARAIRGVVGRHGSDPVGDTELRPGRSFGQVGDVQWDLEWSPGEAIVSPLHGMVARFEPFDTSIVVWPEHDSRGRSRSAPSGSTYSTSQAPSLTTGVGV